MKVTQREARLAGSLGLWSVLTTLSRVHRENHDLPESGTVITLKFEDNSSAVTGTVQEYKLTALSAPPPASHLALPCVHGFCFSKWKLI